LAMDQVDMPLDLEFSLPAEMTDFVDQGAAFVSGFLFNGKSDSQFLLNAMSVLAQTGSPSFAQQRQTGSWDALTAAHLSQLGVDLHTSLSTWANQGLLAQPSSLSALIKSSSHDAAGRIDFKVKKLGSLTGSSTGFISGAQFSWTNDPGDQ